MCSWLASWLKTCQAKKLGNELYLGANVQEEVGLRGAHASTTKFDPEVFLAVDCSPAGDVYGGQGKIGDGTLIRFYDPGHLLLPGMKDFLLTTAEEAGIKYQYYVEKVVQMQEQLIENGGVPSTQSVSALVISTLTKHSMLWTISLKLKLSYKPWLKN